MKLTVELVPSSSWGNNVRSEVPRKTWDKIRLKCYKEAGFVCEVCGGRGRDKHPVECHEVWKYNDLTCKQTLIGFVALCPDCHRVKHIGRTFSVGLGLSAINHLMKVNNMSREEILDYLDTVFATWTRRSKYKWTVDITYMFKYLSI